MISMNIKELTILVVGVVICFVAGCITLVHISPLPTKCVAVTTTSIPQKQQDSST